MLVKLNDGEIVTVMLNHVDEPHAFTLSNRGGTLCGREFHRPAEQGELAATDSQQLQAKIRLVLEQIKGAAFNDDKPTMFRIINETYAELSAMQ